MELIIIVCMFVNHIYKNTMADIIPVAVHVRLYNSDVMESTTGPTRHKSIVDKAQRWALTTRLYRSTNKPLVDKENSVSKSTHTGHDVCTRSDRGSSILKD